MGGAVAAIERGYIQQEIQESAYAYQQEVESGDRVIVGLNRFQVKEPPVQELLEVDPRVRENQTKKIAELRRTRNAEQTGSSLEKLRRVAQGSGNLMAPILECVRSFCTLGEICDVMRDVFGEYRPTAA
jgi:methylmalonyl-CoA mutase N-terminal domain/subunit